MRLSLWHLAEAMKQAVSSTRVKKSAIELSDEAASRIRALLDARHKSFLKLGVKKRGCSGMSYTLNYADEKGKFDELVEEKGVKILIEPTAVMHVLGTRMNYIEDSLKAEFVFENPQAKGKCGCGESFTTS